ncbi:MAG TPA: hypothetical protein VF765_20665 [Polyangiaceae bacterium]
MELRTSEDFARWYAALDQRAAEDVAATLEVIVQLGTEKEAPGSSEWLTWYEHPSLSARLRELAPHQGVDPRLAQSIHDWGAFNGYSRRVIKHLESRAFAERLGQLPPAAAVAVRDAVAEIRRTVTRRVLSMSDYRSRMKLWARAPSAEEALELGRLSEVQEIRDAYLAALGAAGFDVVDVPAHSPALREIALRAPPPGLRLLYGIDVRRHRGLVVLGERFDRSFYGDSVRRAEHVWQEFLNAEGEDCRADP